MGVTAGIVLAGVAVAGSAIQSQKNNNNIRSANTAALKANASNKAYLEAQRGSNQSKLSKSYQKWLARDAVVGSAKGTLGSASSNAAQMSALANALIDSNVVDFNQRAQENNNNMNTQSQIMGNNSRYSNALFAAVGAGAQGFSTGYNMGNAVSEAYGSEPKKAKT